MFLFILSQDLRKCWLFYPAYCSQQLRRHIFCKYFAKTNNCLYGIHVLYSVLWSMLTKNKVKNLVVTCPKWIFFLKFCNSLLGFYRQIQLHWLMLQQLLVRVEWYNTYFTMLKISYIFMGQIQKNWWILLHVHASHAQLSFQFQEITGTLTPLQ